ncbi:SET and MYND domain-containing protein DDB_G0273589-like [Contarinia nasturtii]|uniref:SET and MYND domain-containing protein DDB_G0273589-like n=1 Tax=Contarinia nasturtii TaxID=265458 RepID=UPI0012D477EC|nr:SET and MYND domain-containing protein DDB_G0273589-like [Contarinia nasturtii]
MSKLEKREAECRKHMKESTQIEQVATPVLSFPPNKNFPCMANVLDVQSNEEYGKYIVTKRDIEIGEIVMVEEGYVFDISSSEETSCITCLQSQKNLIPCDNCTDVMFCDHQCMETNENHKIGCGASYNRLHVCRMVIDSILKAVNAFANANDLNKFVECALATREFDSPTCNSREQKEYRSFLKLLAITETLDSVMAMNMVATQYHILSRLSAVKKLFDSEEKQRFLMHLILQHYSIIKRNSLGIHSESNIENQSNVIEIMPIHFSLFNHSCSPNIKYVKIGNKLVAFTVLPVKKGDQLFIQYIKELDNLETKERRDILRETFQFECKCSKCLPCVKVQDSLRMQLDPDFLFIHASRQTHFLDPEKRLILKDKAKRFLKRYNQFKWSDEIEWVSDGFSNCVKKDLGSN